MIDLQQFKEMIIKGVETNFDNDQELTPALFMVSPDKGVGMMPIPAQTDAVKDVLTTMIIPAAIRQTGATMIATVNEAWMRQQKADEKVDTSIPVRDHADKIEVVMVTIETKVSTDMLLWKIVRPGGAKPYLEFDEKSSNSTLIQGRYANLLGQKPSKN